MDYMDTATTGTLSLRTLPIMDLKKMLSHIEETLPSTLHLPVSSEYTCISTAIFVHVVITNKQFLLLIDVPIQDWSQLSIYKIFTLNIPHANFTACYNISTKYLGITQDESWQWKFHHNSSGFVKKQMDSFVPFLHHFNHLQTQCLALLLCMPRIQPDVLFRSGNLQMSVCPLNFHQMIGY